MGESRAIVDPEEILSYWFPPGYDADPETFRQQVLRWFQGGTEVGQEITKLFAPVLEQARRGELDWWAETPRGRLALIIVLDQFSRNVYKGTPLAYAQDPTALQLALSGIEEGMERDWRSWRGYSSRSPWAMPKALTYPSGRIGWFARLRRWWTLRRLICDGCTNTRSRRPRPIARS